VFFTVDDSKFFRSKHSVNKPTKRLFFAWSRGRGVIRGGLKRNFILINLETNMGLKFHINKECHWNGLVGKYLVSESY
jgi:hypothetical protein